MRILAYTSALALFLSVGVAAQDLGSSNKIFGGGSGKPTGTTKKKAAAKATTAKRKSPPAKRSASSASKRKTAEKKNTTAKAAQKTDKRVAAEPPRITKNVAAEEKLEELIVQGDVARDKRDYSAAEAAYKRALAVKPTDYRAAYGLGDLYRDQQRWDKAEDAYRTALRLNPSSGPTYLALSYVLTQPIAAPDLSDRYDEAEKYARKATELSPRSPHAFDQLGVSIELRGLIGKETEDAYRKALELDPSFAPAHAHLGRLLRRRGATKEAKEAFERAIKSASAVGTIVVVAEIMQSEQRYKESESLLRRALDKDRHNPAALIMLGRALMALNRLGEAEPILKRAVSASQNGFTSNSLLATLYTRQKNYEMAEKSLIQALGSVPSYEYQRLAHQFEAVGDGYAASGMHREATRVYRQAAKLDPDKRSLAGKPTR